MIEYPLDPRSNILECKLKIRLTTFMNKAWKSDSYRRRMKIIIETLRLLHLIFPAHYDWSFYGELDTITISVYISILNLHLSISIFQTHAVN